tara:strand:+ start:1243 stop:1680 length:438 start_codon:yes stop_codon:yes gene_type:complete
MTQIQITAGGKPVGEPVSTTPLNLVYKSPNMHEELGYPDCVSVDSQAAMYHAERVVQPHVLTMDAMKYVFGEGLPSPLSNGGFGVKHLFGMLDLTFKFIDTVNVPVVMKYPETGLHPAAAVKLGDIVIALMQYQQTKKWALPTSQ